MKAIILCFMVLFSAVLFSQTIVCSKEDKEIFNSKISELKVVQPEGAGETIKAVGLTFLGTPYVAKTLELGDTENLVINLHGLDCTTYVENTLAFSTLLISGNLDFDSYTRTLESIRYRDGNLNGYASRLHYFSDWIVNNEKKGFVRDVTKEVGGEKLQKTINFMSTHRHLYPFLVNDENYIEIKSTEEELSQKSIWVLPSNKILDNENKIKDGDIIALTTTIKGLDITHTGLAFFKEDGRLHLLHASSSGEVTITDNPLTEYLKGIKNNSGIMVVRPTVTIK